MGFISGSDISDLFIWIQCDGHGEERDFQLVHTTTSSWLLLLTFMYK